MAIPETKEGELIYNMYPTNETADRIDFYNEVFKHYGKDPIKLDDALNYPEDANKNLKNLEAKMKKNSYQYKGESCKDIDNLERMYYR